MMRLHCAEKVTDEIGERYGSVEYRAGKVLQRWRGSPISSILMSFLCCQLQLK